MTALSVATVPLQAAADSPSAASAVGSATATAKVPAPTVVWDDCRRAGSLTGALRPHPGARRPDAAEARHAAGFELYRRKDKTRKSLGTLVAHEGGPGYPSTASRGYYRGAFRPPTERHAMFSWWTSEAPALREPCCASRSSTEPSRTSRRSQPAASSWAGAPTPTARRTVRTTWPRSSTRWESGRSTCTVLSYGTFFAQTFAVRYLDRARTLVLDASYPLSGNDPWWRDTNRAITDALTQSVRAGRPVRRAVRLCCGPRQDDSRPAAQGPVRGMGYDAEGNRRRVKLSGVNLALVTAYATYGTSIYRELDAAVRAYRRGL